MPENVSINVYFCDLEPMQASSHIEIKVVIYARSIFNFVPVLSTMKKHVGKFNGIGTLMVSLLDRKWEWK